MITPRWLNRHTTRTQKNLRSRYVSCWASLAFIFISPHSQSLARAVYKSSARSWVATLRWRRCSRNVLGCVRCAGLIAGRGPEFYTGAFPPFGSLLP